MIQYIKIVLRAWRENGDAIREDEFARAIAPSLSKYPCDGLGEDERAVLLIGCEQKVGPLAEVSEFGLFIASIQRRMAEFSADLFRVPAANFRQLESTGVHLDMSVSISLDD